MRLANCMPLCTAGSPEIGEHAIVSFVRSDEASSAAAKSRELHLCNAHLARRPFPSHSEAAPQSAPGGILKRDLLLMLKGVNFAGFSERPLIRKEKYPDCHPDFPCRGHNHKGASVGSRWSASCGIRSGRVSAGAQGRHRKLLLLGAAANGRNGVTGHDLLGIARRGMPRVR